MSVHDKTQVIEMRSRHACDICNFKSTSETVLRQHIRLNHENKKKSNPGKTSKRKECNICGKQFNKDTTLEKHMKKEHGNPTRMEGQGSSQKVKAIRNEVQGQVKN